MNPLTSQHLAQKLIAIALLWIGLAALVYVPSATPGFESSMIAAGGFLAFAAGVLRFSNAHKAELLEELRVHTRESADDDLQ